MNKLILITILALVAFSNAQMDDEDDFEGAHDGAGFSSSEESQEFASSDNNPDDDRFSGESRFSPVEAPFTDDVKNDFERRMDNIDGSLDREKRSTSDTPYPLIRVRRGHMDHTPPPPPPPPPVGPVHTHVKTDYHGHFKWGVKHKVQGATPPPMMMDPHGGH